MAKQNINPARPKVNHSGRNGRGPTIEEYEQAPVILSQVAASLSKAPPDQFANVLKRAWSNQLYDLYAHGLLNESQIQNAIEIGARGRASCMGVLDEFFAKELPRPRTIQDIRAELGFCDASYQPGDEPDELIKRLLPKDGVTMIGGQSGAGKTFVLIAMTLALVTGTPFLGHPVREKVGVIIVAAEGAGTISARFEAAARHSGIKEALKDLPIGIIKKPPILDTPEAVQKLTHDINVLAGEMEERHGVRVGVLGIDTISSAFAIQNENDNSEAASICKHLAIMADKLRMAVVPVHHFGKAQEQGLRGASAWRANVDHALSVIAERDAATGQVTARSMNIMKSRIGEEGPACGVKLIPTTLGQNRHGEDIVTCAVEVTDVTPSTKSKKLPSAKADRQFSKAFDDVMIAQGKLRKIRGDGPPARMVPIDRVREEFMKRHITGGGANRTSTSRMAWKRALERALDGGCYAARVDDDTGLEMIWDLIAELPFETGVEIRET